MGAYWSTVEDSTLVTDTNHRRYGWIPDKPDSRDHLCKAIYYFNTPTQVDLREKYQLPEVYDQGALGSCTGNGTAFGYQFEEIKQKTETQFLPSRLFIYYNARAREGNTGTDSGASIRDAVKSVVKLGVCPETEEYWPYDISKYAEKPPENCYLEAQNHKALEYCRVFQYKNQLEGILKEGTPIIFGVLVYQSFESEEVAKTGIVPMPNTKKETLLGGHCIVLVGYDRKKKHFIFRNSWGSEWGDHGYGYLPYDYVLNQKLASDFWIIKKISQD